MKIHDAIITSKLARSNCPIEDALSKAINSLPTRRSEFPCERRQSPEDHHSLTNVPASVSVFTDYYTTRSSRFIQTFASESISVAAIYVAQAEPAATVIPLKH